MTEYDKFTLNDLDKALEGLMKSKVASNFSALVGKELYIGIQKTIMEKSNVPQEKINAEVKWMEDNLEEGMYMVP